MNDISETIREYEQSASPIRRRIDELNQMLSGQRKMGPRDTVKILEARRYHLYCELAQLHQAIDAMRDYLRYSRLWPI